MSTVIIMFIFLIFFSLIILIGIKKKNEDNTFLNKQDTLFLKGFWAIIIILVHIPMEYHNKIQDLLGSFAYIGVTFFFIASAYGLKYSNENKKGYLKSFFKTRLTKLIIPMIVVGLLLVLMNMCLLKSYSFNIDDFVNAWVVRLLFVYVIFWLFHRFIFKNNSKNADLFTSIIVLIYSLLGCFPTLSSIFRWNVEIIGFIVGLTIYNHKVIVKLDIKSTIIAMLVSCFLGFLYLNFKDIAFWGDYLLRILLTIAINYFSFQVLNVFSFGNRINNLLGGISYEIYLCHPGIINIFQKLFTDVNSGVFIVAVILASIFLALITHILVQKITIIFGKKEGRMKNESVTC